MHCHEEVNSQLLADVGSIALVGQPNVGKSVIFQRLTGKRVIVSNYPGTTVEVARGTAQALPGMILVDTPGVIAFPPHSDDEQVTARVLFNEPLKAILQVGDAKNLRRTLLLSIQLAEMGLPLVLALNMTDEAKARGIDLDTRRLSEDLDIPVISTTAIRGLGVNELVIALRQADAPHFQLEYPPEIETGVKAFIALLDEKLRQPSPITERALALLWFSGDSLAENWLHASLDADTFALVQAHRQGLEDCLSGSLSEGIQKARLDFVDRIARQVLVDAGTEDEGLGVRLGRLSTHPVWGLFILALVLGALYWFVGVIGAGTLVGLLEEKLFAQVINPWVMSWIERLVHVPLLVDFLLGEYGLWTMGMTYALALILPIVTTFFLAFGVMEDSGYLPRLAVLSNRMFQALGLNGKAVLPMVLGLGCVTMATLTTRVLENKRERLLVTLLLALAVPCSAQLGVVMGMLAGISLAAVLIWSGVVFLVLLVVGWLAARLVPGERSMLLVELPPLRWPQFSNVLIKTLARLEWYLKEVVPIFLLGTALMFALDKTGILDLLLRASQPLVTGWLGLPPEASAAFLMGFLRRDFGATGLFVMQSQGLLSPLQVEVAMVTVTLFIPCIASVMMIAKERTWRTALGMMVLIFPLALLVGGVLYRVLLLVGWNA
jgi:ferrous iron transport protein B